MSAARAATCPAWVQRVDLQSGELEPDRCGEPLDAEGRCELHGGSVGSHLSPSPERSQEA